MESQRSPSSSTLPEEPSHESNDLMLSLPRQRWLWGEIVQYDNSWFSSRLLPNVIRFQKHFQAHADDIILASFPKSGTTWLKALLFSIVNRSRYSLSNTPLLSSNPHDLVLGLEFKVYNPDQIPGLETLPSPRLFSTHLPYACLPNSIKENDCRIVYVCRNPFDSLVSRWLFLQQVKSDDTLPLTLEEFLDSFCRGAVPFGPFFENVLEYWKKSKEMPDKVLFLKYEDMKKETTFHLKRLAKFIGLPFSPEEEKEGVIKGIEELCSLNSLKDLEINKNGSQKFFDNKSFFRKGEVGDWVNHLSPSSVEHLDNIMKQKLSGSGLSFEVSPQPQTTAGSSMDSESSSRSST